MVCADDPSFDRALLASLGWASPRLIDDTLAALPRDSLPNDPGERRRWLVYALLQRTADANRLDALGWANEDRINEYLDRIDHGERPANSRESDLWLKYLPANRAQKHSRRRHLLERFREDLCRVGLVVPPDSPPPDANAQVEDELSKVRKLTTDREWKLLARAAAERLKVVAESENLSLGTLKSLLSRCRARLRRALLGAA